MGSYLVNPITLLRFSEQTISASGQTVNPNFVANVSTTGGAISVNAPAGGGVSSLPEGTCFAVQDVGGAAATSVITVSGNGLLIDGATTYTLDENNGVVVFIVDNGQWRRIDVKRQFVDGQPTVIRADAEAASSVWTPVVDLNFAGLTSQSIATDGAYALGGYAFTKFNSANDQSAMAIVNGQGLVIQPKSTSDYNGANRTFPGLNCAIAVPFATGARLRMTVYVASQNITNNYDGVIFGVDSQSNVCGYLAKYGKVSTGTGTTAFIQAAGSNAGFTDSTVTLGATSNVLRMIVPNYGWPSLGVGYAAGTLNVIPSDASFNPTRSQNAYATSTDMSGLTRANMALVLGAQRAGSVTALSITLSRVLVEYAP